MMKRVISFMTGADHNLLCSSDPGSRKRYEAYAIAMLFPVGLWAYLGYEIGGQSILTGILSALMVWIFDRAIIMNGSNGWIKFIRLVIALSMSLIGMIIIDEQIYRKDIEQELSKQRLQMTRNMNSGIYLQINELLKEKENWQIKVSAADNAFRKEINYPSRPGFGKLAASLQQQSEFCQKKLDQVDGQLNILQESISEIEANAYNPGILDTIHILWNLILRDWLKMIIAGLIIILVLGLETFPLLLKWGSLATGYDIRLYIESNNFRQLRKVA